MKGVPHPNTGLVPCKIITASPANGMRAGEIRGFDPEHAEKLVAAKHVEYVDFEVTKAKTADKPSKAGKQGEAA